MDCKGLSVSTERETAAIRRKTERRVDEIPPRDLAKSITTKGETA